MLIWGECFVFKISDVSKCFETCSKGLSEIFGEFRLFAIISTNCCQARDFVSELTGIRYSYQRPALVPLHRIISRILCQSNENECLMLAPSVSLMASQNSVVFEKHWGK